MSEAALYVYAIVPSTTSPEPGKGIDAREVVAVDGGSGVSALAHRQDTAPYEGPDDEVRRWVLEHSEVIDRAWQVAGTALPVSFNVIVAPREGATAEGVLRQWLTDNSAALQKKLSALANHSELRVEISVSIDTVAAEAPEIEGLTAEMASKPEGVQRLYRKKLESLRHDVSDRVADELYPGFRRRVVEHAVAVDENRRSRPDEGTVPVLNVALLVADTDVDRLGIELADIRDSQPGIGIRFLGPWPPYSFADLPELEFGQSPAQGD